MVILVARNEQLIACAAADLVFIDGAIGSYYRNTYKHPHFALDINKYFCENRTDRMQNIYVKGSWNDF